eukprot:12430485-Karenia_brevis.AAC.1
MAACMCRSWPLQEDAEDVWEREARRLRERQQHERVQRDREQQEARQRAHEKQKRQQREEQALHHSSPTT